MAVEVSARAAGNNKHAAPRCRRGAGELPRASTRENNIVTNWTATYRGKAANGIISKRAC